MSDSLRPRGLQHARLLCPPMASVVRSNSRPLSQWYCQTISSPAAPFFAFSLSQHRRFPMSLHFASGGWSIGASASASVLPVSIQGWFPLNWFDLLTVQGHLKSLLQHHNPEASIVWHSAFLMVHLSEPYMTIGKTIALAIQTFVGKVMSLLFNMLSRFFIAFLFFSPFFLLLFLLLFSRSKCLLISWMQSPSIGILEPKNLFLNIWILCRWYSQVICFFKLLVYKAVSGLKQNREAGIAFSHVSFSFTYEQLPLHPYPCHNGPCVIPDESALTQHSQNPDLPRVHSCSCIPPGFGQMCSNRYPSL